MNTLSITRLLTYSLFAASISLLTACGGDDAPASPSTSGLYKNGTLTLDNDVVSQTDLRGFVHNNRLIMFSIDGHVLFDGQLSAVTGSSYTGTVNVYENGAKTQSNVAISGTVISRNELSGTFGDTGTGVASGGFSLAFDLAYNTAATRMRLQGVRQTDWDGNLLSTYSLADDSANQDRVTAYVEGENDAFGAGVYNDDISKGCLFEGVYSTAAVNIYALTQDLLDSEIFNVENCDFPLDTDVGYAQYTGFASVLSESTTVTDNNLLYAITNGEYAVFGLVVKQLP